MGGERSTRNNLPHARKGQVQFGFLPQASNWWTKCSRDCRGPCGEAEGASLPYQDKTPASHALRFPVRASDPLPAQHSADPGFHAKAGVRVHHVPFPPERDAALLGLLPRCRGAEREAAELKNPRQSRPKKQSASPAAQAEANGGAELNHKAVVRISPPSPAFKKVSQVLGDPVTHGGQQKKSGGGREGGEGQHKQPQ